MILVVLAMCAALAQEPMITPPEATSIAQAEYPPDALAAGLEADVTVEIELDATGAVLDARVVDPAGHGFDEAALTAARASRFTPALVDGAPAAITFAVVYGFHPPKMSGVERLEGRVLHLGTVRAVPGATVVVEAGGAAVTLTAGADGRFVFDGLPAGVVRVRAEAPGFQSSTMELEIVAGVAATATLRLEAPDEDLTVAVAGYRVAAATPVERRLSAVTVRGVAGAFGDPVRAVETLPGVAVNPGYDGQPVVRGAEGAHTRVTVDGVDVPFVFHWFLGRSIVNPALLDEIRFLPGGLPADVGQSAQASLDARFVRKKEGAGLHGRASVDVLDGSLALWGQARGWDVSAAGRFAWVGAVVSAATAASETSLAPNYLDWSASASRRFGPHTVTVSGFGAGDSLRSGNNVVEGMEDLPYDPRVSFSRAFHRGVVRWSTAWSGGEQESFVALGWQSELNPEGRVLLNGLDGVRNGRLAGASIQFHQRTVLRGDRLALAFGADGDHVRLGETSYEDLTDVHTTHLAVGWASPFAELRPTLGPVSLAVGARATAYGLPSGVTFTPEPRISARFGVSDAVDVVTYGGAYTQRPIAVQLSAVSGGDPTLAPIRSWSGGARLETRWPRAGFTLTAESWVSTMPSLVVRQARDTVATRGQPVATLQPLPAYREGTGGSVGGSLMWELDPGERWFGWTSVSVGRTWREAGGETFRSDRDQPFTWTGSGGVRLGKGWQASGRVRVASGAPYTPPVPVYQQGADGWGAVAGPRNGGRLPLVRQVDLRIEKTLVRDRTRVTTYLDVYNATAAKNPLFPEFTPDYRRLVTRAYIPIIPDLGVEVTF
jgi:TonB family protein